LSTFFIGLELLLGNNNDFSSVLFFLVSYSQKYSKETKVRPKKKKIITKKIAFDCSRQWHLLKTMC